MSSVPRLRMIAGPNGSGKSTIKSILPPLLLGHYINPDEIEQKIRIAGSLDLTEFHLKINGEEVKAFFSNSLLLKKNNLADISEKLAVENNRIIIPQQLLNSYIGSVVSDFIRNKLLSNKSSFTFETVMSHEDKIRLLFEASKLGYRNYLYYIATDDPQINISRVKNRVQQNGHSVPEIKIRERYFRSLDLLIKAIKKSNRAYIFDNSTHGTEKVWLAEITDGKSIELKNDFVPRWFETAVLNKIND